MKHKNTYFSSYEYDSDLTIVLFCVVNKYLHHYSLCTISVQPSKMVNASRFFFRETRYL